MADDKLNVPEVMISLFDRKENIAREGENAGYQYFLLSPQGLQKQFLLWVFEIW